MDTATVLALAGLALVAASAGYLIFTSSRETSWDDIHKMGVRQRIVGSLALIGTAIQALAFVLG